VSVEKEKVSKQKGLCVLMLCRLCCQAAGFRRRSHRKTVVQDRNRTERQREGGCGVFSAESTAAVIASPQTRSSGTTIASSSLPYSLQHVSHIQDRKSSASAPDAWIAHGSAAISSSDDPSHLLHLSLLPRFGHHLVSSPRILSRQRRFQRFSPSNSMLTHQSYASSGYSVSDWCYDTIRV